MKKISEIRLRGASEMFWQYFDDLKDESIPYKSYLVSIKNLIDETIADECDE